MFGRHWTFGNWEPPFKALNITVLEFYPIVLALHLWGVQLSNKCVVLHTDMAHVAGQGVHALAS